MKTTRSLIARANITATIKVVPANPQFPDEDEFLEHYKIVLHRTGRQMTTYYSRNLHSGPPTIADILEALAIDASFTEEAERFEQYASDPGFDYISDLWCIPLVNQMVKTAAQLKRFLGDEYYRELISIFES